jgi:autotransporter passenger strand-loop-strand repeat protein
LNDNAIANATVVNGGVFTVYYGGTASGTTVNSGGLLFVASVGIARNTKVSSGGLMTVEGVDSGTTLIGGSLDSLETAGEEVIGTGSALNTVVSSGGILGVYAGGSAIHPTISSGGQEVVVGGGTTGGTSIDTTVNSGALLVVPAVSGSATNAILSGTTTISAGTAAVSGGIVILGEGATVGGPIVFSGPTTPSVYGGLLVISGTTMPTATISGFVTRDVIDLGSIAYDAAGRAVLGPNNVLRVTENGQIYNLQLDPIQNFAGMSFKAYDDGHGGTDIALEAGFDIKIYPGADVMSAIWNNTNVGWVGYYLAPAPDRVNATWMGSRQTLADEGWQIAPIYVGTQEWFGHFRDGLGSENKTPPSAATGVRDGNQAVNELQAEGFAAGTTVYLDIESENPGIPGGTDGINSGNKVAPNGPTDGQQELSYIASWCRTVAAAGYNPGIYCTRPAYWSISAVLAAAGVNNAPFWIARWNYDPNTTSAPLPDPPPSLSEVPNATVWQYTSPAQITYPGGALNGVDLDSFGPPPAAVIIADGKTQDVPPDQELDNPDVQPGGTLDDGGTVTDASVGGTLNVLAGGTAYPAAINSGARRSSTPAASMLPR